MRNNISITLVIICVLILSVIIGYHIEKSYYTNSVLNYLCEKYNATENDFELIDYERSKYFLNDDAIPQLEKGYYKWELKYNERIFFVNMIDGKYYDDYQLEDVEKWCIEWLQDNIEKSIYCLEISSFDYYEYQQKTGNNIEFSKDMVLDFFHSFDEQKINETKYLYVLFKNGNIDESKLKKRIRNSFELYGLLFEYKQKQNIKISRINKCNYEQNLSETERK